MAAWPRWYFFGLLCIRAAETDKRADLSGRGIVPEIPDRLWRRACGWSTSGEEKDFSKKILEAVL